jgi:hypothetical protein
VRCLRCCYPRYLLLISIIIRHVLTGSYHNFFRIYDTDTLNDVVLQADKSAFKAKKIGGPLPGVKQGAKNGARPTNLREAMQMDTLDFNKKILHASWHPKENTIAVRSHVSSSLRRAFIFSDGILMDLFPFIRLPQQTTCSYIVLHDARISQTNRLKFCSSAAADYPACPYSSRPSHLVVYVHF